MGEYCVSVFVSVFVRVLCVACEIGATFVCMYCSCCTCVVLFVDNYLTFCVRVCIWVFCSVCSGHLVLLLLLVVVFVELIVAEMC